MKTVKFVIKELEYVKLAKKDIFWVLINNVLNVQLIVMFATVLSVHNVLKDQLKIIVKTWEQIWNKLIL